jgi:hypothetical protein
MSSFWAQEAEKWLRENPGWHNTRKIAEGVGYDGAYHNFSEHLHQIKGIEYLWRGPLVQMLWSLTEHIEEGR